MPTNYYAHNLLQYNQLKQLQYNSLVTLNSCKFYQEYWFNGKMSSCKNHQPNVNLQVCQLGQQHVALGIQVGAKPLFGVYYPMSKACIGRLSIES